MFISGVLSQACVKATRVFTGCVAKRTAEESLARVEAVGLATRVVKVGVFCVMSCGVDT